MNLKTHMEEVAKRRLALGSINENTFNIYTQAKNRLPPSLLAAPIQKLKRRDIEDAVIEMNARGLSPKTIRHAITVLSSAMNDAVDNELILANPTLRVKMPKALPRVNRNVADNDLKAALAVARTHPMGWVFRFALGTGMRRGEMLALDWGDIDMTTGEVSVTKSYTMIGKTPSIVPTKTASSIRKLTLPPSLLVEARGRRGTEGPDRPVFVNQRGDRVSPTLASTGIKSLMVSAGLGNQTLHSLRHTHASQLVSAGAPLPVIQQRMGHSNIATTLGIYAHVKAGEDAKAAALTEGAV